MQIAKVGKNRKKRKGGGLLGLGAQPAGARVFAGAVASSGEATAIPATGLSSSLGPLGAKIFMGVMIGICGMGVYSARQAFNHRPQIPTAPQVFERHVAPQAQAHAQAASAANLPTDKPGDSSLNMIKTNLPEMTPPPAPLAQAAAAAPAAAPQGQGGPDISALAQAAQAAKAGGSGGSPFDSKIGQLDSGMPTLSGGGPGLSGGVGMPFKAMKPASFLQKPTAMSMAQATPAMGGAARAGGGGAGRAFSQAVGAARNSQAGANTSGDNASYLASQPFDNGIASPNSIGSPQGIGSGSGLLGNADANPSVNPNNGGSPSSGGGGGYGNPNSCPGCVSPIAPTNVTPWQSEATLAGILLTVASALLLLAAYFTYQNLWGVTIAKWLGGIAATLGGIASLMGVMIALQGQSLQGSLFATAGAITTAAGLWVAFDASIAQNGISMVQAIELSTVGVMDAALSGIQFGNPNWG